ncbi:MAG: ABC transporter permease [Anaerolineae bacterium]
MAATLTLWHKHMTKFFRNPEAAFGMLLQPVLWVALFGVGMRSFIGGESFVENFISFMVPGIIALAALSGAVSGGSIMLNERLNGITKEYMAAPIPRYAILAGSALSTATKGLFQAILIAALGLIIGSSISMNPLGWLAALGYIGLYAIGMAGLALAVAASVNSTLGYHGLIALDLPLLFASSALYPLVLLPGWMQVIGRLNPTTYVIDAVRSLMYGVEYAGQANNWLALGVLIGFALFGIVLSTVAFRAQIRRTT